MLRWAFVVVVVFALGPVVVCWLVLCCWFAAGGYVWCFVLLCLEMIVVFLDGCVCFVTWLSAGCDLYDCSFKCCCVLIVL